MPLILMGFSCVKKDGLIDKAFALFLSISYFMLLQ